jgi:hypothetical protein
MKSAGLALIDPVESMDANVRASKVMNSDTTQVMRGQDTFSLQDHPATTSKVKAEIKKQKEAVHKTALAGMLKLPPMSLPCTLMRGSDTRARRTVLPSTIAGTELSSYEFCDSIHIQYGHTPAGLQPTCDGCGASFNNHHALSCAKCGLVILRHNNLHE